MTVANICLSFSTYSCSTTAWIIKLLHMVVLGVLYLHDDSDGLRASTCEMQRQMVAWQQTDVVGVTAQLTAAAVVRVDTARAACALATVSTNQG